MRRDRIGSDVARTSISVAMLVIVSMIIGACRGNEMPKSTATVSDAMLGKVAGQRIFFGHQSVGFNIVDGVMDIAREKPGIRLNVVKSNDPGAFQSPVFGHDTVGENDDPASKAGDFETDMRKGLGDKVGIAFFKFCYIDINKTTDVGKVFGTYKDTMERLKSAYPTVRFIHVTVPLTVTTPSIKGFVKKMLGKEDNNINRNRYNELLRKEYGGRDPLFDLAKAESTYPNGQRCTFTEGGRHYFSLVPEFSDDGGHLNERGRREVAAELLRTLASVD